MPDLPEKWHRLAEARCLAAGERLTPARLAAYAELVASKRPLSAYELVALLGTRQQRKVAPLTVYRHLDFLTRVGLVHRLETRQAYLPCDHPEHVHDCQYLLCSHCGDVVEVRSQRLGELLEAIAGEHGFQPDNAVVEVNGLCGNCSIQGSSSESSPCGDTGNDREPG